MGQPNDLKPDVLEPDSCFLYQAHVDVKQPNDLKPDVFKPDSYFLYQAPTDVKQPNDLKLDLLEPDSYFLCQAPIDNCPPDIKEDNTMVLNEAAADIHHTNIHQEFLKVPLSINEQV